MKDENGFHLHATLKSSPLSHNTKCWPVSTLKEVKDVEQIKPSEHEATLKI